MQQNISKLSLDRQTIKLAKRSFRLQEEQKDCGSACLASVLRFYGTKFTISELNELTGTSSNGTTVLGLYTACKDLGLDVDGLRAKGTDNLKELNGLAILHVVIDKSLYHYIVYFGKLSDGKHLIGNPDRGVYEIDDAELNEIWQSKILLSIKAPSFFHHDNAGYKKKIKIFKDILGAQKKGIYISIFLGLIIAGLSLSTALFYQYFIDKIMPSKNVEKLLVSFFALTLLLIANTTLSYIREIVIHRQSKGLNVKVFSDFFENLIYLPKSFFERRKTGDLTSRLVDIRQIDLFITQAVGNAIINVLLIIIFLIVIFTKSPGSALILTLTIPLTFLITRHFIGEIIPLQKQTLSNYGSTESIFYDIAKGIDTIKTYSKERTFFNVIYSAYNRFQATSFNLNKTDSTFNLSINFTMVLGSMCVLFMTSTQVLSGNLLLGEMLAIVFLSSTVINSANSFIPILMLYRKVEVSINRVIDQMILPTDRDDFKAIEFGIVQKINVSNLSFGFIGYEKILKRIDFEANRGEIVLINGDIGSGKSLFFSLLLRMYHFEGSLTINNSDGSIYSAYDIPKAQWRTIFGIIPQEVAIFNGSILDNIIMDASVEEITYARARQIFDLVFKHSCSNLPGGALTLIGQGGVKLSGGQAKLLGLARALFCNPQILLLDEFTAGMDSETERYTSELINEIKGNFMTIVISHQPLMNIRFDRRYNLEQGELLLKEL